MKFVYKADSLEGAREIKSLLENAGIPASISNKGFAQLHVPFIPHYLGVFIFIKSQYDDAMALINDNNHVVREPVDIVQFYNTMESTTNQDNVHSAMNDFIFGMVAFGIVCALLIYVLS